jgi:hypothetical protein
MQAIISRFDTHMHWCFREWAACAVHAFAFPICTPLHSLVGALRVVGGIAKSSRKNNTVVRKNSTTCIQLCTCAYLCLCVFACTSTRGKVVMLQAYSVCKLGALHASLISCRRGACPDGMRCWFAVLADKYFNCTAQSAERTCMQQKYWVPLWFTGAF